MIIPYDQSIIPAGPVLEVLIRHPDNSNASEVVPLIVDSGADQTVLPFELISRLGIPILNQSNAIGFGNVLFNVLECDVELSIATMTPLQIPVLMSAGNTHYVLGRDVLNRYRVILDGPNQTLEIG